MIMSAGRCCPLVTFTISPTATCGGQEYSSMEEKNKQFACLECQFVIFFHPVRRTASCTEQLEIASQSQSTFHCKFGNIKAFPLLKSKQLCRAKRQAIRNCELLWLIFNRNGFFFFIILALPRFRGFLQSYFPQ